MRFESARNHGLISRSGPPVEAVAFDSVNAFLDFLAELPPDEWLAIGALEAVDAQTAANLEATILDQRLAVDAWRIRDDIQTLAFLAHRSLSTPSTQAHCMMARARAAAERAALAIVARRWLAPADVADLLSPFSARVSIGLVRAR